MGDRMLWRCRRGMRELDKVVEGYYLLHYESATEQTKEAFESLLEEADPDLLSWVMGRTEPPNQYSPLIEVMRTLGSR